MEETLIDDSNIKDFLDQDLEGLKVLMECAYLNINTTPESLNQEPKFQYRICKCGSILYKNHKSEYRCGQCGSILF